MTGRIWRAAARVHCHVWSEWWAARASTALFLRKLVAIGCTCNVNLNGNAVRYAVVAQSRTATAERTRSLRLQHDREPCRGVTIDTTALIRIELELKRNGKGARNFLWVGAPDSTARPIRSKL